MVLDSTMDALLDNLPLRWERLGLVPDPRRGLVWARPDGRLVVELEPVAPGRLRLQARVPTAAGLIVMPRKLALIPQQGLDTGDATFDGDLFLAAEDPTVLGLLDVDTRARLRQVIIAGALVAGGAFVLPEGLVTGLRARLEPFLADVLTLAGRLAAGPEARVAGVLALVRDDPLTSVRAALRARFAEHAEVRALAARRARDTTFVDPWDALDAHAARVDRLVATGAPSEVAPSLATLAPELVAAAAQAIERELAAGGLPPEVAHGYVAWLDHNPALADTTRARLYAALGRTRRPAFAEWLASAADHHDPQVFEAAFVGLLRCAGPRAGIARLLSPAARDRAVRAAPDLVLAEPALAGPVLAELYRFVDASAHGLRARYAEAFAATGDPSGGLSLGDDDARGGLTLDEP